MHLFADLFHHLIENLCHLPISVIGIVAGNTAVKVTYRIFQSPVLMGPESNVVLLSNEDRDKLM
jgi:hypothetical protein